MTMKLEHRCHYKVKQMKYKDERIKLINEALSGIKVHSTDRGGIFSFE